MSPVSSKKDTAGWQKKIFCYFLEYAVLRIVCIASDFSFDYKPSVYSGLCVLKAIMLKPISAVKKTVMPSPGFGCTVSMALRTTLCRNIPWLIAITFLSDHSCIPRMISALCGSVPLADSKL